jgi:hypothetical protein
MKRSTTAPWEGLLEFALYALGGAVLLIPFLGYGPLIAMLLSVGLSVVVLDRLLLEAA